MRKILCILAAFVLLTIVGCSSKKGGNHPANDSSKTLTAFSIDSPSETGTVDESAKTVVVTVPYGTDVTKLTVIFTTTGTKTLIGTAEQTSGVTVNDFTATVTYTVVAKDSSTQDYKVTVTVAANSAKAINTFSINGVAGTVSETTKTIAITLPYGTIPSALVPTISNTGATISPASGVAQNFTAPVIYTVTAADGSTQTYTVTLFFAANTSREISAFSLASYTGTISGTDISVSVPFATDVTALVPTISYTGTTVSPSSGVAQNFTSPVIYTVTAADGSTKNYTVTVTVASNTAKEITAFSLSGNTGTIIGTAIAVTVPYGTNVTALVATYTTTGASVTVSGTAQTSGSTANSFSSPVTYKVTAADASIKNYIVTVTVALNAAKAITAFSLAGYTGIITGTNIAVNVPFGTNVTALVSTFTTTGASVTVGGTAQTSGSSANNFSGSVTYTVTAANGTTQDYIVTVTIGSISVVTHFAGSVGGYGSGDGTGVSARFYYLQDVTSDGANLYVADTGNSTIRKIVKATGVVTTLAGMAGSTGSTDGTGASARFYRPYAITNDGTNLYVSDTVNYNIRKIVITTGVVTTIAGTTGTMGSADGNGTSASFGQISGITYIGGNLYATDTYNQTIRKIVIATGDVTTIAGLAATSGITNGTGTAARFNEPLGITNDGTNLYVSENRNTCIRKIIIASGAVTTFAGTMATFGYADGIGTAAKFRQPEAITCDGTSLYVSDTYNYLIRKIDIATQTVSTLAGTFNVAGSADGTGTAAQFNISFGLSSDGTNLYVADTFNHCIRKIVIASGVVTTAAGTVNLSGTTDGTGAAARFKSPYGITSDGTNFYVADTENHTIRKIVIATGEVSTFAGTAGSSGSTNGTGIAAKFYNPCGITSDGTNLYVVDQYNNCIRKIVIASAAVTTFAGTAGTIGYDDGFGTAAKFGFPQGITNDGINLYVADGWSSTIRKIVISTGEVTTYAGQAGNYVPTDGIGTSATFASPNGILSVGANLYVLDGCIIRKIVKATAEVTTVAGTPDTYGYNDGIGASAQFNNLGEMTSDGTCLYVADANRVRRIVIATYEVTTLAGIAGTSGSTDGPGNMAQFNSVKGIILNGGNLYVTEQYNNCIRKIGL